LKNLGKSEEAIACYDKALLLNPNYVAAYNNKGIALGNLGKSEEAIVCYDKALALNPNYVAAYNNKQFVLKEREYQKEMDPNFFRKVLLKFQRVFR
jgi:tetratricopeptide (TPR) repeat protein